MEPQKPQRTRADEARRRRREMMTQPHRYRATGLRRELTAAQLHRRALGEFWNAKSNEILNSPIYTGTARSRRSWCSRLRELELHPDRLEALKARP